MTLPVVLTAGTSAYNIQRSLRFRSSASAYLSRTPASASNQKTWTLSFWMKRGSDIGSAYSNIFSARTGASGTYTIAQFASDTIEFVDNGGMSLSTTQVFRDPSAWYHFVFAIDTTQATSSNRVKLYVNGIQITAFSTATYPSQNADLNVNSTATQLFGQNASSQYADYYLAEINHIDGQALTPSSFGQTNSATGVWQPAKYTGTYGTNGFYLPFTDTTSTTTISEDFSGNNNDWTSNNISLTAGSTYDSMTDVPTLTNATTANYCVQNPLSISIANPSTLAWANLLQTGNSGGYYQGGVLGTVGMTTGKFYWEATVTSLFTTNGYQFWGVAPNNYTIPSGNDAATTVPGNTGIYGGSIQLSGSGTTTLLANSGATNTNINSGFGNVAVNDVIQIAFDVDSGKIWFGRNGTWYNSGNPVAGTNPTATLTITGYTPFLPCNATYTNSDQMALNYGQRPFSYTAPSGFKALNTFNLPTPTIGATASSQANKYMDISLYTGTGSSQSITGLNFQPDWTWIKGRSGATDHGLYDAVRGVQKQLESNNTDAETTETTGLTAFNSNGFTVGALAQLNTSSATYVAWNWKANGSGSTNTAGSITSTVSANTTAGFSIATYTGTGSAATVGHGLGVAPKMIIIKDRDNGTYDWNVYHASLSSPTTLKLYLNTTDAETNGGTNSGTWNSTAPTSTVFSLGTFLNVNKSGDNFVAYCFAQVAGYSAFGSYTGNGSSDGPFIFTGFRPRFVMVKRTDSTGNWYNLDTARNTFNVVNLLLQPNQSSSESTFTFSDYLSNGFKLRDNSADWNASGGTFIYMAFAENPFKYSLAR